MSQELTRINEKAITPFLQPKQSDLIQMIGEIELKKQTSFAIQACQSNSLLMQATPASVAKCIWNSAIVGLTLNPVQKMAYLTPRRDANGNWEAILMPSYQGLVKLITDTGSVSNVYAYPVYKGDEFKVVFGTTIEILHEPKFLTNKKEDITHFYAVAILHDGTKQIEVMGIEDVYGIRARSDGYRAFISGKAKSAIWETDFSEMGRKTVLKRITKYVPKTDQNKWEKVNEAIHIDNQDYPATDGQKEYVEVLLRTSGYDHDTRQLILDKCQDVSSYEAEKIIMDLKHNQLNAITSGNAASAKEINAAVNDKLS